MYTVRHDFVVDPLVRFIARSRKLEQRVIAGCPIPTEEVKDAIIRQVETEYNTVDKDWHLIQTVYVSVHRENTRMY